MAFDYFKCEYDDMSDIDQKIENAIDADNTQNQFAVSQVPFHTHNGADSQQIAFGSLTGRFEFINETLVGATAATAANYGVFWIAPYKCMFIGVTEAHQTAGSDGSAVTVQLEHLTGTVASGSGTSLLLAGFNMKAAVNTVQTATLANIPKTYFNFAKGDRLGLVLTGTPTSIAGAVFIAQISY